MVRLFGSRARDESDFDLLVVLPDGLPERAYTHEAVAEPLTASGLAYDVAPCRCRRSWPRVRPAGASSRARCARAGCSTRTADRGPRQAGRAA